MTTQIINKIEGIESALQAFQDKANEEIKNAGKVSHETKNALDSIGTKQKEIADRLLAIEQSGPSNVGAQRTDTVVDVINKSSSYASYIAGNSEKSRFEISNAVVTGSDVTVSPDRKEGIVGGPEQPLTLESFLTSIPTTSNAIEYTRESSFTNAAAEKAEATPSAETAFTFALEVMPVSSVSHNTPISKQVAADAPALASYINQRMIYGVNLKVEHQLANGTGISPALSGLLKAGNFTAHGYTAANIGTVLSKFVLIRKMIADAWVTGYPADAILLNPVDFGQMEIDALVSTGSQNRVSVNAAGTPTLFSLPVVQSIGVPAGQVLVGSFGMSATIHNREGVVIEMSNSHGTNFVSGIITVQAERRLALTVERPAGIIAGTLTPA